MTMKQIWPVAVLNAAGLGAASWGITMLMGIYPLFIPPVENAIAFGGIALSALSTMGLIFQSTLSGKHGLKHQPSISSEPSTAFPISNQTQLLMAVQNLTEETQNLIEKRREIYYLNTQRWHQPHKEETVAEIEATKRYRGAKNSLDLERLASPTQFWSPVDNFCAVIEKGVTDEVYSAPGDRVVHEAISEFSQRRLQQDTLRAIPILDPSGRTNAKHPNQGQHGMDSQYAQRNP